MAYWRDVTSRARAIAQKKHQREPEDEYSDAPESFIDPLLNTLMTDPVKLPCGAIVDRTTIESHMQHSEMNPFTGRKMTMDMIESEDDLRKSIAKWKKEKDENKEKKTKFEG